MRQEIVLKMKPEIPIPVHSDYPDFYIEHLTGNKVSVILPVVGSTVEI